LGIFLDAGVANISVFFEVLAEFELTGGPIDILHKNGVLIIDLEILLCAFLVVIIILRLRGGFFRRSGTTILLFRTDRTSFSLIGDLVGFRNDDLATIKLFSRIEQSLFQ